MDKPEGMPDDIWDMAEEISMNTANSYIGNTRAVATAIIKAKNDALEGLIPVLEALKYTEDMGLDQEMISYNDGLEGAIQEIAQAIRNLKHEG